MTERLIYAGITLAWSSDSFSLAVGYFSRAATYPRGLGSKYGSLVGSEELMGFRWNVCVFSTFEIKIFMGCLFGM